MESEAKVVVRYCIIKFQLVFATCHVTLFGCGTMGHFLTYILRPR